MQLTQRKGDWLIGDGRFLVHPIPVLLVDSDAQERVRLLEGLKPWFVTTEASTAEEALRILETQRRIHAIVTDYNLSGENGVWLLEQVQEKYANINRVLVSRWSVPNAFELRDRGVFWIFLPKPVDPATLSAYFITPNEPLE